MCACSELYCMFVHTILFTVSDDLIPLTHPIRACADIRCAKFVIR